MILCLPKVEYTDDEMSKWKQKINNSHYHNRNYNKKQTLKKEDKLKIKNVIRYAKEKMKIKDKLNKEYINLKEKLSKIKRKLNLIRSRYYRSKDTKIKLTQYRKIKKLINERRKIKIKNIIVQNKINKLSKKYCKSKIYCQCGGHYMSGHRKDHILTKIHTDHFGTMPQSV